MELYVKNSTPFIVEFWQKFIGRLTHLMNGDMEENVRYIHVIRIVYSTAQ